MVYCGKVVEIFFKNGDGSAITVILNFPGKEGSGTSSSNYAGAGFSTFCLLVKLVNISEGFNNLLLPDTFRAIMAKSAAIYMAAY